MYIYDKQRDAIHRNHPKHWNLENRCFRFRRPQKSPKIAQKTITQSRFAQFFLIGMVHIRWYLIHLALLYRTFHVTNHIFSEWISHWQLHFTILTSYSSLCFLSMQTKYFPNIQMSDFPLST